MIETVLAIGFVFCMMAICVTTSLIALKKVLNEHNDEPTIDIESIALTALKGNAFSFCISDSRPLPIEDINQYRPNIETRILTLPLPINIKRETQKDGRILSNKREVV